MLFDFHLIKDRRQLKNEVLVDIVVVVVTIMQTLFGRQGTSHCHQNYLTGFLGNVLFYYIESKGVRSVGFTRNAKGLLVMRGFGMS